MPCVQYISFKCILKSRIEASLGFEINSQSESKAPIPLTLSYECSNSRPQILSVPRLFSFLALLLLLLPLLCSYFTLFCVLLTDFNCAILAFSTVILIDHDPLVPLVDVYKDFLFMTAFRIIHKRIVGHRAVALISLYISSIKILGNEVILISSKLRSCVASKADRVELFLLEQQIVLDYLSRCCAMT
jgi:hypothetical protein